MKLGAALFLHALMMVVRNFLPAIRIFLGPGLIIAALVFAVTNVMDRAGLGSVGGFPDGEALRMIGLTVLLIFGTIAACTVIMMWAIVAWHRFILLGESPGLLLPQLKLAHLGSYFLNSLKLAGVVLLIMLPIAMVLSGFGEVLEANLEASANRLFGVLAMLLFSAFVMRFAVILPAAAINKSITLGEAITATKGRFFNLLVLVICSFGFRSSGEYLMDLLAGVQGLHFFASIVFSFLLFVLQISVLTTLYGHFVEGRPVT